MKKLLFALALLVALAIGLGAWFYSSLDELLRQGIEKAGTTILQTAVTLDGVTLAPADGRGELRGLSIANPPGFAGPNALKAARVALAVDPASLTGAVVHVRELAVDAAQLAYEDGPGGTNLDVLRHNVERFGHPAEPKSAPDGAAKRLRVDHLALHGTQVTYRGKLTLHKPLALTLPDIDLRDLGKDSGGLTPDQLTRTVLDALARQTTASVAERVKGTARQLGDRVGGGIKGLFGK